MVEILVRYPPTSNLPKLQGVTSPKLYSRLPASSRYMPRLVLKTLKAGANAQPSAKMGWWWYWADFIDPFIEKKLFLTVWVHHQKKTHFCQKVTAAICRESVPICREQSRFVGWSKKSLKKQILILKSLFIFDVFLIHAASQPEFVV